MVVDTRSQPDPGEPPPRLASPLTLLTYAQQEMTHPPTQNGTDARYEQAIRVTE